MQLKDVILVQGVYYFVTGIWPILHLRSFEKVTGKKQDRWLLYTVSWMILCSSLVLLYGSMKGTISTEILILAISNILTLTGIDLYYALRDVIRKIYLLDAVLELILLGAIAFTY